jgi:hypothetical protein
MPRLPRRPKKTTKKELVAKPEPQPKSNVVYNIRIVIDNQNRVSVGGFPKTPTAAFRAMSAATEAIAMYFIDQARKGELEERRIVLPNGVKFPVI